MRPISPEGPGNADIAAGHAEDLMIRVDRWLAGSLSAMAEVGAVF